MSRRGWSPKEDEVVTQLVSKYGTKNWAAVSHDLTHIYNFKSRTGKQCRERYHNHLDPAISKDSWTADEEALLFRLHNKYGNRWTTIAEHLEGRTDNTLKNHFYSTIRRSLRRISKLTGSKNSTQQMKSIKPSSLSKIFAINVNPSTEQEVEDERAKCEQNPAYRELVGYIHRHCGELTEVILEFSDVKPKGRNCVLAASERPRYEEVIEKMVRLNELYEKMKKEQRRLNLKFTLSLADDSSEGAEDSQVGRVKAEECESSSPEKVSLRANRARSKRQIKRPKSFEEQLLEIRPIKRERKESMIILRKDSHLVRERTQMEKQSAEKAPKSDSAIKEEESFNHLCESHLGNLGSSQSPVKKPSRKQVFGRKPKEPIKSSLRSRGRPGTQRGEIRGEEGQRFEVEVENVNSRHELDGGQNEELENLFRPMEFEIDVQNIPQGISHSQESNAFPPFSNPNFQLNETPVAPTPNYFFNTPALPFTHSPFVGTVSAMSHQSDNTLNLISHINNNWNVKVGELDDIAENLGYQIASKSHEVRTGQRSQLSQSFYSESVGMSQSGSSGGAHPLSRSVRSQSSQRNPSKSEEDHVAQSDGRTNSSRSRSIINSSPHSAFRSCH